MSRLLEFARRVRHAPGLPKSEKFWSWLRPAFHRLLDPFGRGVPIPVGHGHTMRVPVELTGTVAGWSTYEQECVDATVAWARNHPTGVMFDLGCAVGMFSTLVLQRGPLLKVIAVDADLVSLACTRRLAAHDADRLTLLWGLLDAVQPNPATMSEAVAETGRHLADPRISADLAGSQYRCLGDTPAGTIPRYSLDVLGAVNLLRPGATLVKCDVEGAELLVLQGATNLLAQIRPVLLLSVHPPALPSYGHTTEDVAAFLTSHGYRWNVIARDHEEHWLAQPIL